MNIWKNDHPGIMVIMSANNVEEYIQRTLFSIEVALRDFKWILVVGDDGSEDRTGEFLSSYRSLSADKYIFQRFSKATSVGQAKNRVVKMAIPFKNEYEAVVFMDADDVMSESRVKHLLPLAIEKKAIGVFGDHIRIGKEYPDNLQIFKASKNGFFLNHFGPWATLFHSSLLPDDGGLFREDVYGFDDGCLFAHWLSRGILFEPCPGKVVHSYMRRPGTVYTPIDPKFNRMVHRRFEDIKFEYFAGKRVDIGLETKFSFYFTIKEGFKPGSLIDTLRRNLEVFVHFPMIEFVVVDFSDSAKTILKYPFAKELSCGILTCLNGKGLTENGVNSAVASSCKGDLICYIPSGYVINGFQIGKIESQKIDTVFCEGQIVVMNKDFFIKQNS
jgi:glycosyltransferase involved in cell wall biosynthesis